MDDRPAAERAVGFVVVQPSCQHFLVERQSMAGRPAATGPTTCRPGDPHDVVLFAHAEMGCSGNNGTADVDCTTLIEPRPAAPPPRTAVPGRYCS